MYKTINGGRNLKKTLYIGALLATIVLAGCNANEETETQPTDSKVLTDEQTNEIMHLSHTDQVAVEKSMPLQLTLEQKEEYYQQYKETVEEANNTKIGIGLGVPPMADFKPEDWVEPKEYEKKIQEHIDSFLKEERETLSSLPSTTTKAVADSNGRMIKKITLYISDILFSVEVTGDFETQYNESLKGQVFAEVNNISSHIASSSHGKWEQTYSDASLIDNGRTYSIRMEGIYHLNGLSTEKAFTIEFDCDSFGNIY